MCHIFICVPLNYIASRLGVSFLLNVDQDEYLTSIDDVAGLVAVIHDQNTVPFPEDEGLTVHPGELLSIGVRKVNRYYYWCKLANDLHRVHESVVVWVNHWCI